MEKGESLSHQGKLTPSLYWMSATAFLGAFNDNIFRWILIGFLIGNLDASGSSMSSSMVTSLGTVIFVLPFLIFSAFAGNLADRISKRNILVTVKCTEILVMSIACLAFLSGNEIFLYAMLFFMAMQSAFFGPSKYGIVPELVDKEAISKANGFLEMVTNLAIIAGTTLGLKLSDFAKQMSLNNPEDPLSQHYAITTLFCVATAVVGVIISLFIKKTPPAGGKHKASLIFIKDIYKTMSSIRSNKAMVLVIYASACFMFIGGFVQTSVVPFGQQVLNMTAEESGFLFLIAALGIGLGSMLAGKISGRGVELGLVPLGAVGLTISFFTLGSIDNPPKIICEIFMFTLGLSGGLFIVPLHAYVQYYSPPKQLGEILAASYFIGWVGVCLSGVVTYLLNDVFGYTSQETFKVLGLCVLILTISILKILPEFFARVVFLFITRLLYRVKMSGLENVPQKGPALLVCNHASWVDAVMIVISQQRLVRFLMARELCFKWYLRPLTKLAGVIPISNNDPPKEIINSLKQARTALENGELVCIFPEGALTKNGNMQSFKSGFEKIVKNTDAPIIPVYIGGIWGSILSHYRGKLMSFFPKQIPYPVSVIFGKPMPTETTAWQARQAVMELSTDYIESRKTKKDTLSYKFISTVRRHWFKKAISDSSDRTFTYGKTLIASIVMARKLKTIVKEDKQIGVALPSASPTAICNLAIAIMQRTSVNLNFTLSKDALYSTIEQSELNYIVTSRAFIEKIDLDLPEEKLIYLEDVRPEITTQDKVIAFLLARFCPKYILAKQFTADPDAIATIIFSSGSTARPKGIMLSHYNIISNINAGQDVIRFKPDENICGMLPFFHSFGYVFTFWFPLIVGISVVYHANPLDSETIGDMAKKHKSTALLSTPTFLTMYIRKVDPECFKHIRIVIAGAEKLKSRIADMFEKRFGVRPREGYGATELSPLVSLNLADVEFDGFYQVGTKEGSVGHPIPCVCPKVVDPNTLETLGMNEEGLLLIKGPNVMKGYINDIDRTEQAIQDGWYHTGDIAKLDEDGFITITDRLARFSKLGGEMIPHGAIEEVLLSGLNTEQQVVAVTSVPDDKKGEQLIVLYTQEAGEIEQLYQLIDQSNLSNLSRPRKDNYFLVDEMPLLGSGKLDIKGLRQIALDKKSTGDKS